MHVKSHQAGKRGKCPKCGTKFEIPALPDGEVPETESSSGSEGEVGPPAPPRAVATPSAAPVVRKASAAGKPVVWYVRTKEGHFGPTHEGAIREWISDGRITAGNWVWRDGWEEWRPAESVYPELQVAGSPIVSTSDGPTGPGHTVRGEQGSAKTATLGPAVAQRTKSPALKPDAPLPLPSSLGADTAVEPSGLPPGRVAARRRRVAKRRWTAVVVLSVASLVLLIALVCVVRSS